MELSSTLITLVLSIKLIPSVHYVFFRKVSGKISHKCVYIAETNLSSGFKCLMRKKEKIVTSPML